MHSLQWALHNHSCARGCTSPGQLCPATAGPQLHKVKHTRKVGCGDGGGDATSIHPQLTTTVSLSEPSSDKCWLIRYATHYVFLVQFDRLIFYPKPEEATTNTKCMQGQEIQYNETWVMTLGTTLGCSKCHAQKTMVPKFVLGHNSVL